MLTLFFGGYKCLHILVYNGRYSQLCISEFEPSRVVNVEANQV